MANHHIPVGGHHRVDGAFGGDVSVERRVSAPHCQRLGQGSGGMQCAQVSSGGEEEALLAVGLLDAGELPDDRLHGFVPGDTFVLLLTPFADPLHRVEQAILVVDVLAIRPASETGPQLLFWIVVIIALYLGDDTVPDMDDQGTAPATVNR